RRRLGPTLALSAATVPIAAAALSATMVAVLLRGLAHRGDELGQGRAVPWNRLARQRLDGSECLLVTGSDDGCRIARTAGAARAADAVHVILGVVRHVEVEDVAHSRNIEA